MQLRVSRCVLLAMLLACALAAPVAAQNPDQMSYMPMSTAKFVSLPVLPACATFAVERGDPTKGASVLLLKVTSGCVIPWHWHTATESLKTVSGKAKVEMKSGGPTMMSAGDYVYLPAKQAHQFTCMSKCMIFLSTDGAFDIHYLDAAGKEIPPEQALKPMAKSAPMKTP